MQRFSVIHIHKERHYADKTVENEITSKKY